MPSRQIKENSCACYGSSDIHDCYCNLNNKNMKTQTAVEWLIEQLSSSKYIYNLMEEIECQSTIVQPNIFEQAKAMEKEQMDKVSEDWWVEGCAYMKDGKRIYESFEQYYNEIYKQD